MAELLYLEGLHAQTAGDPGAGRADLTRALAVFDRLPVAWRPHADLPSAGERVDEIRQSVAG